MERGSRPQIGTEAERHRDTLRDCRIPRQQLDSDRDTVEIAPSELALLKLAQTQHAEGPRAEEPDAGPETEREHESSAEVFDRDTLEMPPSSRREVVAEARERQGEAPRQSIAPAIREPLPTLIDGSLDDSLGSSQDSQADIEDEDRHAAIPTPDESLS